MADTIGRRVFLGRTAMSATAASLALRSLRADEAPSRKVVVGVMGLSRGRTLAANFAKEAGVEVKYVCDTDTTRAAAAAKSLEKGGQKDAADWRVP